MRLSARIGELKDKGHDIDVKMVKFKSRYGRVAHFARYSLA
jgi:hypothetical protein